MSFEENTIAVMISKLVDSDQKVVGPRLDIVAINEGFDKGLLDRALGASSTRADCYRCRPWAVPSCGIETGPYWDFDSLECVNTKKLADR